MNSEVKERLRIFFGEKDLHARPVAGGDAAQAWCVEPESGKRYFLKTVEWGAPFQMEAEGLTLLSCESGIRIPKVIDVADHYLLLEWIEFGSPSPDFQKRLGEQLARTHLTVRNDHYGFFENHYIGATPQKNLPWVKQEPGSWAEFWWTHRLQPMLERLGSRELSDVGERLSCKLPDILPDPLGSASLLHGDLWSGNVGADEKGQPFIFDPAPYYGHPEAELAMTRMFGGFSTDFIQAYVSSNPLEKGWEARQDIYMLYHVLNHACIFGGSYLTQARQLLLRTL